MIVPSAAYLLVLGALLSANAAGPERWWWSAVNLYLPQWLWAFPGLALLGGALWRARRWTVLPVAGLALVLGPLMGFVWATPPRAAGRGARLRVMSYNVEWGRRGADRVAAEIRSARPDLLLMQDARLILEGPVGELLQGWNTLAPRHLVAASRWPLQVWPGDPPPRKGGPVPNSQRFHLQLGDARVAVYNVHLATPRDGLVSLRFNGLEGLQLFERDTAARLLEAATVATEIRGERDPLLVAGDLNSPVQGLSCRTLLQAGLADAFSTAGRGYGYTFGHTLRVRHSFLRLDHILVNRRWRVVACRTGGDGASDHRPVIADLQLLDP